MVAGVSATLAVGLLALGAGGAEAATAAMVEEAMAGASAGEAALRVRQPRWVRRRCADRRGPRRRRGGPPDESSKVMRERCQEQREPPIN